MEKNTNATPKPIDHAYAQQAIQSFLKRHDPEDVQPKSSDTATPRTW